MLNWEPVEFFQKGCNMTHFVKSEDDAAKSILDSVVWLCWTCLPHRVKSYSSLDDYSP